MTLIKSSKLLIALPAFALLAACNAPTETKYQTGGALYGAALGAALSSKEDRLAGAAIGGTVGAIAGDYAARTQTAGQCQYRAADGSTYTAACPR